MSTPASNEVISVLIKFSVCGSLRLLSHAETVKLFARACVRAGLKLRYSSGFSRRPRLSLPLPRSVGVESCDDLLCLQLTDSIGSFNAERLKAELSAQLPEGCCLISIKAFEGKVSPQPTQATYILPVKPGCLDDELKSRIRHLLESKSLNLERRIDAGGNTRNIDVRGFLTKIDLGSRGVSVECKITPAGSIRVEEILRLLDLSPEMLVSPIRRTNVQWQIK